MIQKILWVLHIDLALLGYQLASTLCAVGFLYRIMAWFRYPPNRTLWGRSAKAWSVLARRERLATLARSMVTRLVFQTYIFRRGWLRGVTHISIFWGVVIAGGGSLALTWGTLSFSLVNQQTYRARFFDVPLLDFQTHTVLAFLIFNMINLGSLLLLGGLLIALWQRFTVRRAETAERPQAHLGALYLLLALTVTGLFLAVSYKFLGGLGHGYLVFLHEITVVLGLLWLPFGKFFHLAVSPAFVALDLAERAGVVEPSRCSCCNRTLSAVWRPGDLQGALINAGFAPNSAGPGPSESTLCPSCRQRRQAALLRLGTGRSSYPVEIRGQLRQEADCG